MLFINQNVLHDYRGDEAGGCVVYALLFDMHFLSGLYNSELERKYFLPVKEGGMDFYSFSPDSNERLEIARLFLRAIDDLRDEPFGYELALRSELSRIWIMLLKETEGLRSGGVKVKSADSERIKKMIEYIHTNYPEKVTEEDIAAAAGLSVRECCRCFERSIGIPPVKYLTMYRLHAAAEKLLETDASILDVSEACGFSSSSYFGKVFSEAMGCTPREYRLSGGVMQTDG